MTVTVSGSQITFNDNSTQNTAATGFGFKNRIINPAMVIDQRNAGASVSTTATNQAAYTIDRWMYQVSQASKFTVQQNAGSVTPPVGFNNYLGITSTSAYSVTSGDYFVVGQTIEGFNIADLGFGTANAATITLSFWVRSSLTGTFGGALRGGNSSANAVSYPFTYTVSSANTWTSVSITIPGSTIGSSWQVTNGAGLQIWFSMGSGSSLSGTAGSWQAINVASATGATSVVGTNGATFYITGVQLEVGSTATSFDYRPYGTELVLCQRYYEEMGVLYQTSSWTSITNTGYYRVSKRAAPTITNVYSSGTGGAFTSFGGASDTTMVFQSSVHTTQSGGTVKASAEL